MERSERKRRSRRSVGNKDTRCFQAIGSRKRLANLWRAVVDAPADGSSQETFSMVLFAEFVLETFPGGGPISVVRDGVGLGSVIAVVCSWQRNRSILWAILAGVFSWVYVVYFAITRRPDETRWS